MTVKQLIDELMNFDMNSRVVITIGGGTDYSHCRYASPEYCFDYEDGNITIFTKEAKSEKEFFGEE